MQKKTIITENSELTLSAIPMPKDSNMQDAVFGGWILSQLDLAGSVPARRIAIKQNKRAVTKAVKNVDFIAPVLVGDKVDFYTTIKNVGNTSISIHIEAIAERYTDGTHEKVIEAEFVYVCIPHI